MNEPDVMPAASIDASYRMLFRQHPAPMWVCDAETLRFLDVNDAAVRSYGYTREEFRAMTIIDIRPPAEIDRLQRTLAQVHEERYDRPDLWLHRRKDGALITVRVTAHPLDFAGRPARLVMAEDVTDRVAAEREVRDIKERMHFALDAARVGIWEVNLATKSVYWSETCEALYGLAPGAFGRSYDAFLALVHPDDRQQVIDAMDHARAGRAVTEIEFRTIWPDGSERWIRKSVRWSFDDAGAPTRAAGVVTDVTERRSLEQRLQQSQKMESLGQLAGSVAHDFNNMLTAILGNAAFLLDDLAPADARRACVEEIQRAGQRAATLTGQLLAFSRKKVVSARPMSVRTVIEGITPMLHRLIGESIDMRLSLQDTRPIVADPSQLEQVLVNLAVNARDAMPEGGRLILSTNDVVIDRNYEQAHPDLRHGSYVMIRVTDTGHGMTAATRKRIFEPFFTTKGPGKGTGLGLATVYGAITQCGGHIDVHSAVNQGTTFTIHLPQTDKQAAAAGDKPAVRHPERGKETVLVVEDEAAVRKFTEVVLQRYGYLVHAVATGAEALDWLRSREVDLVLSDVVLPEMNGRALARRLRAAKPDLKVLFMSGYAPDDGSAAETLSPFIAKPFTGDALARSVRDALERR